MNEQGARTGRPITKPARSVHLRNDGLTQTIHEKHDRAESKSSIHNSIHIVDIDKKMICRQTRRETDAQEEEPAFLSYTGQQSGHTSGGSGLSRADEIHMRDEGEGYGRRGRIGTNIAMAAARERAGGSA